MNDLLQDIGDPVFKVNTSSASGSGFYLKASNIIITNYHLVEGHREVAVENREKMRYLAKVVFVNPEADLAFLQPSPVLKPPGRLDSFADVETREVVLVLGYPLGMGYTETQGIVSSPRQLVKGRHFIQTDAAINPGSSGGPVVNSRGELVGVATSKFKAAENLGFAIPIDIVKEDLESFKFNNDLKFSVKCNFCKLLVFEKTNYCKNCGHTIHSSVFERFNPDTAALFVEDALILMGLNPVLARGGQDYWEFYQGSSLISIYFHNGDYLYAMAPINQLPAKDLDKLFKYLLSKPLSTYRLGVMENNICLSYRVHLWDIYSWNAGAVMKDLAMFALKADEMSCFFRDYFGCALSHYSRETGVKEEEANPGLLAVSYSSRAESLKNIGKWEEALELHKKAEKLYGKLGDDPGKARTWISQAQILTEKIKWAEALELHRKAESLYENRGDRIEKAGCIISQAQIIARQGKWEAARELYKKARHIYEEMDHQQGLAQSLQSQARALMEEQEQEQEPEEEKDKENRFREAMNLLERAETLYEQLGDYWGFIENNNLMADLLIKEGRLQQASTLPNRVQRFLFVSGRRLELAMFYGARAQFFRYYDLLDIALDFSKRELRCYLELGHRQGQAYSFFRQAEILTEMEEFASAVGACRKAQTLFEELAHPEGLADTYSEMALLLMVMGKEQEFVNLHKKVEKIYEDLHDPEGLAYKYHRYCHILYGREKWAIAIEYSKKAEKIFETRCNREILADIYEIQALIILNQWQNPKDINVLMQLPETPENIQEPVEQEKEKKPELLLDQAMKLIKRTEDIYKQLDKKKELANTWWNKGCILFDQKEYDKGLELWEKSIQIRKELELPYEDFEKKLKDMKRSIPYA
ncbi:MAG: trypsin-like peptidase domain-containing protein [Candidatus Aminicenantes bacterium]|jgi:tetratricopeptide (TPR) repeat protein